MSLRDRIEAIELAHFYLDTAHRSARSQYNTGGGDERIVSDSQAGDCFKELAKRAERVGDAGVRQREYLHQLHIVVEDKIQRAVEA